MEDLQKLIDVVDAFCRKWQMEINLTKSEAMVVGDFGCPRCSGSTTQRLLPGCCPEPCTPWTCRGAIVKVVQKYKYLGLWFTHDLSWSAHVAATLNKSRKKTQSLSTMMRNKRIPVRAKLLVWLSYVRPTLEYGAEVWTPSPKESRRIESTQTQAGARILKLNTKTKTHAIRALMHVPTLARRRQMARLKYLGKLKSMQMERNARQVVELPAKAASRG